MEYRVARWSGDARHGHALAALAVLAFAGIAHRLMGPLALETQLTMTVAACLLVGLPHRAFDPWLGHAVFAPSAGPFWVLLYGVFHVGLALLVMAGWVLAPSWTLAVLLAMGAVHLGLGDACDMRAARLVDVLLRLVHVLTRGGAPIALAILFHSAEVARLIGWTIGDVPQAISVVFGYGVPLALAWQGLYAVTLTRLLWLALARSSTPAGLEAAELALLVLIFAALPPILAVGLYLSVLHGPRHLIDVAVARGDADPARASRATAIAALPLTLVGGACVVIFFLAMRDTGAPPGAALRLGLWAVTALAAPHMILTALTTRPLLARERRRSDGRG